MVSITVFPTQHDAEEQLEIRLQKNLDILGALHGFSAEERKKAGINIPLANPGKELTLFVELYWFLGAYTFDMGALKLVEKLALKAYPALEELAQGVQERLSDYPIHSGSTGVLVITPLFYTLEQYEDPFKMMNDQEKERIRQEVQVISSQLARDFVHVLDEMFETTAPVARGLTAEEREEFSQVYKRVQKNLISS